MAYIRSNEDWYIANGDFRSYTQRAKQLRKCAENKHIQDSIRNELLREADQNDRDAKSLDTH